MSLDFLVDEKDRVKEGVLLIDLSQVALASATSSFEPNEKITEGMLRHMVLNSIRFNTVKFRKEGYTKVCLCVDNAKNGYWRRDFAYYYKKNRGKDRDESKWDWEGYFTGIRTIIEELKQYMPYYVIDVDKAEADDGIAVLTKELTLKGHKVMIISSDGDFTQLHKFPNVSQWSPMQKKLVKPKSGSAQVDLMAKILKGDRKDNVASIKVRSDYWFTFIEGERTPPTKTDFIVKCADSSDDEIKSLLTETEYNRFLENRVLIDFDYIREDIASSILELYNNYVQPKRGLIYSYFVKSGLSKLTNNINDF